MPFPYSLSHSALLIGAVILSSSVSAETSFRQHDAHVHGVVEFNIAQDGKDLLMEITAPGADVVGFEHTPSNEQQQQALESAIQQLKNAHTLFTFTNAANCRLTEAHITETLTTHNEHHDCHNHDEHDHGDHNEHEHGKHSHDHHDEHEHGKHDHDHHNEHEHGKHAHDHHDEHEHDKHSRDHHDEHEHDKHSHDHHDEHEHGTHGEFSAQYAFRCDNIEQLKDLQVNWFKHFLNTEKITVQAITETSQKAEQLTANSTQFKF